jgi:hypothetical protein
MPGAGTHYTGLVKDEKELFMQVVEHNLLARLGCAREHEACQAVLTKIMTFSGEVPEIFRSLFDMGTGIGCDSCTEIYNFARAILIEDRAVTQKFEKDYGSG